MIDQETLRKLREMKLDGLAAGFEELLTRAPPHDMTPIDIIGTLVDREWSERENRRLTRLLKAAKIGHDACLEDVRCEPGRDRERGVVHGPVRPLATRMPPRSAWTCYAPDEAWRPRVRKTARGQVSEETARLQDFSWSGVAWWALQRSLRLSIPAYNRAVRRAGTNGVDPNAAFVGIRGLRTG